MASKNANMALWDKVFTTALEYTKPAKKGAYEFTSITPMYQKMRATEALGPQGQGWGIIPESESFECKEIGTTILLVYRATMFYFWDGKEGRLPIGATEKLAYMTQGANGYLKIDDEADKKVRTAALTKGLSEIGVSADIHMNLHTNYEYQEYVQAKKRIESGDDEEVKKAQDEFNEWMKVQINSFSLVPNVHALNLIVNKALSRMNDKLTLMKASPEKRQSCAAKIQKEADLASERINNKVSEDQKNG